MDQIYLPRRRGAVESRGGAGYRDRARGAPTPALSRAGLNFRGGQGICKMPNAEAGATYSETIALLQKALALCDEAGLGKTATPHLDLALHLLLAEYKAFRVPAPATE